MAGKIKIERRESGIYRVRFTSPSGARVQRSAETTDRRQAEEFGAKLYADAWRVANLGARERKTWLQAATRWLREQEHKRSIGKDETNIVWLGPHLNKLYLDEITADTIRDVAKKRAAEPADKRVKDPAPDAKRTSTSTVNRMLALIRSILRAAVDWEWLDRPPRVKLGVERVERIRWLTREQAATLMDALPEHLKAPARFALATGLREQNVLRLEWSQVDMERRVAWIHHDQAKGGSAFAVPLNSDAVVILRGQQGASKVWAFPGPNETPLVRANNKGWRTAIVKAGVAPLRWHDLRHTWASWHVQAGTPLEVLMQLGGWKSLTMVQRYAHLARSHIADHADAISGPKLVQASKAKKAKRT